MRKNRSIRHRKFELSARINSPQSAQREKQLASAVAEALERRTLLSALTTLASFDGTNGENPYGGVVADSSGNLYGTTQMGGASSDGAVFEVVAGSGVATPVASFDGTNGSQPEAGLIEVGGNLYGTTPMGGPGVEDEGTVFEVVAGSNTITDLVSFTLMGVQSNGSDANGYFPVGGLVADASGNLYGTTSLGGTSDNGTIFEIPAGSNTITTRASFDGTNGGGPLGTLIDVGGNLYGTTAYGGPSYIGTGTGDGTVFELPAGSGTITALASFNGTDGSHPSAGVIADASGNLYGTTSGGGANEDGTVFEIISGSGAIGPYESFDATTGTNPGYGSLIADSQGNLFGTARFGGADSVGTVFEVAAGSDTINPVVSFSDNGMNGIIPYGGLIADAAGNLYGTGEEGGADGANGAVFELTGSGFVAPAPATITSPNTASFAANVANSFTITTSGSPTPTLMETGSLPAGVTFTDNGNGTATLAGMPTQSTAGSFPLSIQASNGVGSPVTQSFTLNVQVPTITQSGTTVTITGTDANDTTSVSVSNGDVIVTIDGQTQSFAMTYVGAITLDLGSGHDTVTIGSGLPSVSVSGGTGSDMITDTNTSSDTIIGGSGAGDTIIGGGAGSLLKGKGGNDLIVAGQLNGGVSSDEVAAAIAGGPGAIFPLVSSASDVTVKGHGANNTISGTGGDKLVGGTGNSLFFDSGYSGDTVNGGTTGLHLAQYNPKDSVSNIYQVFDPPKGVVGTVGTAQDVANPSDDTTVTDSVNAAGVLKVVGTSGNDTISITSDGTNIDIIGNGTTMTPVPLANLTGVSVKGKAGDDIITLGQSVLLPATLNGGGGNDSLVGGGGDNVIISGIGNSTLVGGGGMNLLVPGELKTYANTSPGNDSLVGGAGGTTYADFSYREDGMYLSNDGQPDSGDPSLGEKITIAPSVTGILAGSGSDTIVGMVADELLSGGRGTDSIHGGGVDDTIVGGKGSDSIVVAAEPVVLFLLDNSPDTISGINHPSEDLLSLNSADVLS